VLVLSPFGGRSRMPLEWGMDLATQVDELLAGGSRVETVFPDGGAGDVFDVVGQRLELGRAVLACRVVETDEFARWCRRCGGEAAPRDSVTRWLAHEPLGWRPTTLLITILRYRCTGCGHVRRGGCGLPTPGGRPPPGTPQEPRGSLAFGPVESRCRAMRESCSRPALPGLR
jgi:hypothetical protein